jgi:hypothetical protein
MTAKYNCLRTVVAAGDYVRAKLRCAPFGTHIHRPYSRRYRVGSKVVDSKFRLLIFELSVNQITPWSIIALATFMKPAMLAPFM